MKTVFTIFALINFSINFAQIEKFESLVDSIQKDSKIEIIKEYNPAKKEFSDFFIKQLNKKVKIKIQCNSIQHVSYQLFNDGRNVQMDMIFFELKNKKSTQEKLKGMFQTKGPYNFIYKKIKMKHLF